MIQVRSQPRSYHLDQVSRLNRNNRCATEPIDWRAQTHIGSFVNWNREENLP